MVQCLDFHLEFQSHIEAWNFLEQLFLSRCPKKLQFNFTNLEISPKINGINSAPPSPGDNFPSVMGCYGMNMLFSLGQLFLAKYDKDYVLKKEFISYHNSCERNFYDFCCTLWSDLKKNHCCSIRQILKNHQENPRKNSSATAYIYEIPHVIVTQSRLLFQPMHRTLGHRALRRFGHSGEYRWMLVHVRDENEQPIMISMKYDDQIRNRYEQVLEEGLPVVLYSHKQLYYHYFGSSGSQAKKAEFWFLAPMNAGVKDSAMKVHKARNSLGDIHKIQNVSTYLARVGLYLSSTKSTKVSVDMAII